MTMSRSLLVLTAILGLALSSACTWSGAGEPGAELDPAVVDAELDTWIDQLETGEEVRLAQRRVTQIAQEHPTHARAQWMAAVIADERGDEISTRLYLDRVLQVDPSHAPAHALAARIAVEAGDLGRARKLIDRGLLLRPASVGLHEMDAFVARVSGDLDRASAALDKVEGLGGPRARTAFHRGLIAEAQGDEDAAREAYRRALIADKDFGEAKERLRALEPAEEKTGR